MRDDGVVEEGEVLQFLEVGERLEGWEVGDAVVREVEGGQVGDGGSDAGLDGGDAVARDEERGDLWAEREVAERRDFIVGEVEGLMIL